MSPLKRAVKFSRPVQLACGRALRGWRARAEHNNARTGVEVGSESVNHLLRVRHHCTAGGRSTRPRDKDQDQENGPMTLVHRSEAVLASPVTPIRDGLLG
jgi:hypothetical protein